MKQLASLLIAAILNNLSVNGQENYTIDGVISGDAEGKTVYLLKGNKEQSRVRVDSTIIKGGKFQFKGRVAMPGPYAIKIFPTSDRSSLTKDYKIIGRPHVPLFLSNERILIEAALDQMPLTESKSMMYDFTKVRVSGSKSNDAYVKYIQGMTPLWKAKETVSAPYRAYLAKRPNVPLKEGLAAVGPIDEIDHKTEDFYKSFIKSHGDNLAAVYAFEEAIYSSNEGIFTAAEIDELLAAFSKEIKAMPYFKSVAAVANETKKYAVGQKFTDLTLVDPNYKQVKLSDYVGKGKYVLLDFWGPWCIPCRKEFPFVKQAYEQYHPQGLEILAISVDNHKDRWPKAMKEENLLWQNVAYPVHPFINETGVKTYAYWAIPFYLLIGPDGTIVDRDPHGAHLSKRLMEIYGNKFSSK